MRIVFAVICFVIFNGLFAQQTASVSGKVFSAQSAGSLALAHVTIAETGASAVCDSNGYFRFTGLREGRYLLRFSFIGYAPDSLRINIKAGDHRARVNMTLFPAEVSIPEVIITATRTEQLRGSVPAKTDVIRKEDIDRMPFVTVDELLSLSPGINVTRDYGIYNKTGDVTLRGLNRNVHSLLLMDGLPLSLLDGSASNWNRLDVDQIERIEIVKGPNSSLYGGNAMGGVINIITRKPTERFEGSGKAFYGSFATLGGNIRLAGRTGKEDRKYFYAVVDAYLRQSDGYVMAPDSVRTINDMELYVNEYNMGSKLGYVIAPRHFIETEYRYSYDMRGTGSIIFEQGGNFNRYRTHYARGRYSRTTEKTRLSLDVFWKREHYRKQNESVKSSGAYTFYHTNAVSEESGLFFLWSTLLPGNQELTVGADVRKGSTDNEDTYHTSADTVAYSGSLGFYGIYLQDQLSFFKGRLNLVAGLRFDAVQLSGASFSILSPSLATAFMEPYQGAFPDTTWLAVSPRVGLQWGFSDNKSIYLSWSQGFRPGTLSDMCRTGDVNKGFKLANPALLPESMDNFELGVLLGFGSRFTLEPAVFYSIGHSFQNFVGTGDSMYTGGTRLKPVIRRENIGEVHIYGAELRYTWQISTHFDLIFNYSFNQSRIMKYELGAYVGKDLTGLSLIEVPEHMLFGRLHWKNRWVNAALGAKYSGATWLDDENTVSTEPVFLLDLKLYRTFLKRVTTAITIQNILGTRYTDSKGMLNPGRFMMAEVKFRY